MTQEALQMVARVSGMVMQFWLGFSAFGRDAWKSVDGNTDFLEPS